MRRAVALLSLAALAACTPPAVPEAEPGRSPSATPGSHGEGWRAAACALPVEQLVRIARGYHSRRSPDVFIVPREPNYFGGFSTTTHSGPWDYVQEVPLVFYGPGHVARRGTVRTEPAPTLADVAPTTAALLGYRWPGRRAGRVLDEVLAPGAGAPPRLVVTVVWDGGGWNVLRRWPEAWPNMARLMRGGTSFAGATVGSSPSVTPAVHATLGTGEYPARHGIIDIPVATPGGVIPYAFPQGDPRYLETRTLADDFDGDLGGAPKVGMLAYQFFHLGMMGHGAQIPGADHDFAVIASREHGDVVTGPGRLHTNPGFYALPRGTVGVPGFEENLREVDLDDGQLDGLWRGHVELSDPSHVRHGPVWVLYQTRLIESILSAEGFGTDRVPDLFFTNYKQIDDAGHNWNMLQPEVRDTLAYTDRMLGRLVSYLDSAAGRGRWVLILTADHGQTPDESETGAWPIHMIDFTNHVARSLGSERKKLFAEERPVGLWLDRRVARRLDVTAADVAEVVMDYRIADDQPKIPERYSARRDERLFAAAFPSRATRSILACARRRSG